MVIVLCHSVCLCVCLYSVYVHMHFYMCACVCDVHVCVCLCVCVRTHVYMISICLQRPTHPVYNIGLEKVQDTLGYFSKLSPPIIVSNI